MALRSTPGTSPELGEVALHVARRRRARTGGGLGSVPVRPSGTAPAPGSGVADADPAGDSRPHDGGVGGRVLHVEPVGTSVRILRIGRPAGFDFEAGQYLKLGIAGSPRRSLSLASAPGDPDLELCVELVPQGKVTPLLFRLTVGDRVELAESARGSLRLARTARTHLLVGTVTGIAPLRSLLRAALASGTTDDFVVLHGASHADELPFAAELAELARADERVRYLPTVSRPGEARNRGWRGATGRVEALAERVAGGLDPRTTGVCATGNSSMIANVRTLLGGRGFRVATESFH